MYLTAKIFAIKSFTTEKAEKHKNVLFCANEAID